MEELINGGVMMSGTWTNPRTGDSFTVKDCLIEDNAGAVIYTTDGRRLSMDMISDYIQSDVKIPKMPQQASAASPDNLLLPEDSAFMDPLNYKPGAQYAQRPQQKDETTLILDKAFNKIALPPITMTLKWDNKSGKQLANLHEMMDISYEQIAAYLTTKMKAQFEADLSTAVRNSLIKYNTDKDE
jgi:hypothetical protein